MRSNKGKVIGQSVQKRGDEPDFHFYCDAYSGRTWHWYRHLVAQCITQGSPGSILDVGCGNGLLVECAHRYGMDIIGIDGSEMAIKEAQSRNASLRLQLHNFCEDLPFQENSFATIICHQVIEHLKPSTCLKLFKESYRVLKPGGIFLVYSPSRYNRVETRDPCHINLTSPSRLNCELLSVGFIVKSNNQSLRRIWPHWLGGDALSNLFYSRFKCEPLSLTANAIACKPIDNGMG